jgi:putative Holliday junction resolvase
MAVVDLLELAKALPPGVALAGLDHGEKTIGVALSDISLTVASPAAVISKTKFTRDAHILFDLMTTRGAGALVIGLPMNMDGSEGPRSQSVRAFARNLLRLRDLPIAFWDERLSTMAVNRVLIDEGDLSRSRRARAVDKMAAAWILQGALDRLRAAAANPKVPL